VINDLDEAKRRAAEWLKIMERLYPPAPKRPWVEPTLTELVPKEIP
jgi:hypothetical protein